MKPHPLLLTTIVLSLLLPAAKPDLSGDLSSLLTLRSAVGGRTLKWNPSSPSAPCSWFGVVCSSSPQRVTELHLPGSGLSGQIPPDTFQNLTQLRTLSLRLNRLSGQLPPSLFSSLSSSLRSLYLQGNNFSGPIPDSLFNLTGLVRLNLAGNDFSGQISPSLNNLTRLATLFLQFNNLSGSIPDLTNLKGLKQFNVSHNDLTGEVPESLYRQPASAFTANSLCGGPLASCTNSTDGAIAGVVESIKKRKKLSGGAIAGIVIGSVIGLLLILAILMLLCRKKRNAKNLDSKEVDALNRTEIAILGEKSAGDVNSLSSNGHGVKKNDDDVVISGNGNGSVNNVSVSNKGLVCFGKSGRDFTLDDLLKASAEVLGKGTYGTAYKAGLEGGMVVAVKRLRDVAVPEKEFREKIEFVGRMDHENLVALRAYYYSRDEKLLVYDYMPMGSLSAYLHGNRGAGRAPLNWETRSSIALGSARGITHLHSQGPTVSHGNIKSSNILLTNSHQPRVSDFGLSQLAGPNSTPNRIDGYRAPEVTDPRKISQKADVYSFGVMLLELLTGKAPTHNEEGVDLPRWVQSVVREEWSSEVFDVELVRYNNVEEEMVELLQLAIDCVAQYPDRRPSMGEVSSRIEEICRRSLNQQQNPFGDINGGGDDSDATL